MRQAAAQRLGEGQEVGLGSKISKREVGAEASERGLRLVQDEQHAALCAFGLEPWK